MKMLKEHGAFVLAMLSDNKNGKITSQDMVTVLTAKTSFFLLITMVWWEILESLTRKAIRLMNMS